MRRLNDLARAFKPSVVLWICTLAVFVGAVPEASATADDAPALQSAIAPGEARAVAPATDQEEAVDEAALDALDARVAVLHENAIRNGGLRERIAFADRADEGTSTQYRERFAIERLIDEARGATDPVVLQLLVHRCLLPLAHARCDAVAVAARWTEVDPGNAAAWLALASAFDARGDADGARNSFSRAAAAPAWQSGYLPVARALVGDLPRDAPAPERLALVMRRVSMAALVDLDALHALRKGCASTDSQAPALCAHIIFTMARDADSMLDLQGAAMMAHLGDFGASDIAAFRRKADALEWAIRQSLPPDTKLFEDADTPTARLRAANIDTLLVIGERGFAERRLAELRVTETDAADRYRATLPPEWLRQRNQQDARRPSR